MIVDVDQLESREICRLSGAIDGQSPRSIILTQKRSLRWIERVAGMETGVETLFGAAGWTHWMSKRRYAGRMWRGKRKIVVRSWYGVFRLKKVLRVGGTISKTCLLPSTGRGTVALGSKSISLLGEICVIVC